jgi:hypothetical protein
VQPVIGPGDLIALVTFDGQVYANQAVTRERLGRPPEAAHGLTSALAHWLRRQHLWLEVEGRRIQGIATARPLSSPRAWEIDTLLDAAEPEPGGDDEPSVVRSLLEQAQTEAQRAGVSQLLLRVPAGAPAEAEAVRAGFTRALGERLWRAEPLRDLAVGDGALEVREATAADEQGRFQLYCRALPVKARSAIAMTQDEWRATREDQWLGRHSAAFVAESGGRIVGSARLGAAGGRAQLELLTLPDAPGATRALLAAAAPLCERGQPLLALTPLDAGAAGHELLKAGFEPVEEFVVLSRRVERPVEETLTVGAGVAFSGG